MRVTVYAVLVGLWVLVVGSVADFDTYSRTAFALGILAAVPAFLLAPTERRR